MRLYFPVIPVERLPAWFWQVIAQSVTSTSLNYLRVQEKVVSPVPVEERPTFQYWDWWFAGEAGNDHGVNDSWPNPWQAQDAQAVQEASTFDPTTRPSWIPLPTVMRGGEGVTMPRDVPVYTTVGPPDRDGGALSSAQVGMTFLHQYMPWLRLQAVASSCCSLSGYKPLSLKQVD